MEDMFSGSIVESPPPASITISREAPAPGLATKSTQPFSSADELSPTTAAPPLPREEDRDVIMPDAHTQQFTAPTTKPFREPPPSQEPPAKRLKTEPSTSGYDTSKKIPINQQKFLVALLRQIKKAKDSLPFREPVDPIKLNIPRYFEVIDRPMDLSSIEKKLNVGEYPTTQALVNDFTLMIDNCVTFNGLENPVTKMGKNIQAMFEKGIKNLPPEQVC